MTEHLTFTLPALFGDHHTHEVRSLLANLPGITETVVRPSQHLLALAIDPQRVTRQQIEAALAKQGYRTDEPELVHTSTIEERATRHTSGVAGTGGILTFVEASMPWEGRPLWPCPGLQYTPTLPD